MTRLQNTKSRAGAAARTKCEYRLSLLGGFRLEVKQGATKPIRLARRKVELLLAYLVLFPDPAGHPREKLAALFWGDTPDEQARMSLRTCLAVLRKTLGEEAISADREFIQINPDFRLWVDVWEFLESRSISPEHAVTLYSGDLLPDIYDDWVLAERERLHSLYLQTLLLLTQQFRSQSEYERALDYAHRVIAADPANETAHQHIMFCEMARGNRVAALAQYETCARTLHAELAVEPSPETQGLYHWIEQASLPASLDAARITNLPIPLTSFIGRKTELAQIKAALLGSRLLTLTGAGGSGKTRLAIQVAMDLVQTFRHGVWWVELANVNQPSLVSLSVAKALGIADKPKQTMSEALVSFLRTRELVLILDNCEHLTSACAALADALLRECPSLKIFATSREPLCLVGEKVWYVPTLAIPDQTSTHLETLLACESVRLFCERAHAVKADWRLVDENADSVAQICRRLDGIPLALELAAARVPALSVSDIATRLDDRFGLLISGGRSALPRQQTLRALVDWSHDLLSPQEQTLFRRLAVFGGGRTLAAAEQVCTFGDLPKEQVLDLLSHLVAKSLLVPARQAPAIETRYGFLDTIKHYAREKLEQAGEADEARRRHLDYYVGWAEETKSELDGNRQTEFLDRFEREHVNLRIAIKYAIECGENGKALRLGIALSGFWDVRSYLSEGRDWLHQSLHAGQQELGDAPGEFRLQFAWAQVSASNLAARQGDVDSATNLAKASLTLFHELGDRRGAAAALGVLANVARMQSDWVNACAFGQEALHLAREIPDKPLMATALRQLGIITEYQGNYAEARELYEESLALSRELNNPRAIAITLNNLGNIAQEQGDYARATELYDQVLAVQRAIGARWSLAATLSNIGNVEHSRGEFASARSFHEEALQIMREIGDKRGISVVVNNLGNANLALGDFATARRLDEESMRLRQDLGDKRGVAMVLGNLGDVAVGEHHLTEAEQYYKQALAGLRGIGDKRTIVNCLIGVAEVAALTRHYEYAASIAGGIQTALATLDAEIDVRERERYDETMRLMRSNVEPAAFNAALTEGTLLTIEQLIDLVTGNDH